MKKTLIFTWLFLSCLAASSQQRKLNLTDFKTWSIQANGAMNWAHTDVVDNNLFYSRVNQKFGYGLRLNKFITHNIGLSLDGYRTKFEGVDGIWSYESKINYQVSLLAMVQSGNIRYLSEFEKLQLYGYVGYGTINYESSLVNSNNPIKNNEVKENQQVIPVGIGLKYHLMDNVTLNLEYSMSNLNGDNLDAFNDRFTEHDSYSRLQLGVSYTFGKYYNKELEWHDPRPRNVIQPPRKDTVVIVQKVLVPDTTQKKSLECMKSTDNEINSNDSLSFINSKQTIFYDFNEYKLRESQINLINEFISKYKETSRDNVPGLRIIIESFTDKIGSERNNKIIVQRRAGEVMDLILKQGIDEMLTNVILHGEEDATNDLDSLNRKTVIYMQKN